MESTAATGRPRRRQPSLDAECACLEPSPSARKDTYSAAFLARMSLVLTQCSQHSARSRLPDVGVLSTQANFAADPEAAQAVLSAGFRSAILGNLGESRLLSLS